MKQLLLRSLATIFPFGGTKIRIFLHTSIILNAHISGNGLNGLKNGLNGPNNGPNGLTNGLKILKRTNIRTGTNEAS